MKKLLLSLLLLFPMLVISQRTVKVCGEVDYVVPENQSQAEAKRTASCTEYMENHETEIR